MSAARQTTVLCPRCGYAYTADVGEPWERLDGTWSEWVTVRPHVHGRTGRSTCRPRGFARPARSPEG